MNEDPKSIRVVQVDLTPSPRILDGKAPLRLAYSVAETAELLGISYASVYRLIQRGLLRTSGALRHKMIPLKEIERFLADSLVGK